MRAGEEYSAACGEDAGPPAPLQRESSPRVASSRASWPSLLEALLRGLCRAGLFLILFLSSAMH